jgi:diketogulonate reductase-like aldo/keto reductase
MVQTSDGDVQVTVGGGDDKACSAKDSTAGTCGPRTGKGGKKRGGHAAKLPLTIGVGTQQVFTECRVTPDLVDEMKKLGAPSHFFISVGEQLDWALREGYMLIDTAQVYNNEDGVGQAVRTALKQGIIRRDEVFICTKIDIKNLSPEGVLSSFKKTQEDLGVGVIDLLLLHFPPPPSVRRDTWRAMEQLQHEGKVRLLGVSNHAERHLEELLDFAKSPPVVNQIEVHPYNAQFDLVDYCRSRNISVMGYCPLGGRGAGGNKDGGITDELLADPTIVGIAKDRGMTPAQVMLRWALQRGVSPIPRGTTRAKLAENLDATFFELTSKDMAKLGRLDRGRWLVSDLSRLP